MFGKIENGSLTFAPNPITVEGKNIYNPSAQMLRACGYKPVVYSGRPQDDKSYTQGYEERETEIRIVWLDNEAEYWRNTPYDEAVNAEIRKRYTESQEFAILRQKDEKPEEYAEYYAHCEGCKDLVKSKKAQYSLE